MARTGTRRTTPRSRCPLCAGGNETVLWRDDLCRVILAREPDHPGTCRVIWHRHVAEMTDLTAAHRQHVMHVVFVVESVLRRLLAPRKVNLASLGNQVPHLHWHVIPRFADDAHYPATVWSRRRRQGRAHGVDVSLLTRAIARRLRPQPVSYKQP